MHEDWKQSSGTALCASPHCSVPKKGYYYDQKPSYVKPGKNFTFDLCITHENYKLAFNYFKEFVLEHCTCSGDQCRLKSSFVTSCC